MQKNAFGKRPHQVTKLGFGAWAIGSKGYGKVARAEALAALETYVTNGGNFIDTARAYGNSEEIIGEFMRAHGLRDTLFICSKTHVQERDDILRETEISLQNLGTDYIDLYYLHAPPEDLDQMNKVLDVYSALKKEGKIRSIGASIKGPAVNQSTQDLCKQYIKSKRTDAIQLIFSIFRQTNSSIFDEAKSAGVALVGRTALESGFLTGHYKPNHVFPNGDHRKRWSQEKLNHMLKETASLTKEPALSHLDDLTQLAIRFAYDEERLNTIIVGARNKDQINSHLKAVQAVDLPLNWRDELIERYAANVDMGNP